MASDLARALANPLSNAVTFSPGDGAVEVSLVAHGDGWRITVADEDEGILPDQLAYV